MKNGKSNTVLLTVIGIATLLVAVVGATFAYFSARVTGEDNSVITIKAAEDGTVITVTGVEPVALDKDGIYPRTEPWVTHTVSISSGNAATTSKGEFSFYLIVTEDSFQAGDISYSFVKDTTNWSGITEPQSGDGTIQTAKTTYTTGQTEIQLAHGYVEKGTKFNATYTFNIYFDNNTSANQNYTTVSAGKMPTFNCYIREDYKSISM